MQDTAASRDNENAPESKWHFDKTINIAMVVTLLVAGIGASASGIWFAAGATKDIDELKLARTAISTAQQIQSSLVSTMTERTIRLEGKVDALHAGIQDLKADLKALMLQPANNRR